MQIVRDLAGYTLGRSDLVRRAMSKKKAAVMKRSAGISSTATRRRAYPAVLPGNDEQTANKIYDEMTDFANTL